MEPAAPHTPSRAVFLKKPHLRNAATVLACVGVGLAMGAPFVLGSHALLAGLRAVSPTLFLILAISAIVSAAAKAGQQHLMQAALGLRLRFARTFAMTVVTDSAFLVSPLGAAGYGVNMALLERSGASWAAAATIVGTDQALDLAFFTVAIPISLILALGPLAQVFPKLSVPLACVALALAALLAGGLWLSRRPIAHTLTRMGRRTPWLRSRWAHMSHFAHTVKQQLALLKAGPPQRFIALLVMTTLQWLPRYGALWYILYERGYPLPFGFVLAAQAVILHLALWTGVPAGGGSGDLGLAAAFAAWVPSAVLGTTLVLWRFATLYCPLLLGALGLAALALQRRRRP